MGDKEGDIKKKQYLNKHGLFIVKQIIINNKNNKSSYEG